MSKLCSLKKKLKINKRGFAPWILKKGGLEMIYKITLKKWIDDTITIIKIEKTKLKIK